MRIRFSQTHIYETEGVRKGPKFEEGKVYELRQDIADRFIQNGLADRVADGTKAELPKIVDEGIKGQVPANGRMPKDIAETDAAKPPATPEQTTQMQQGKTPEPVKEATEKLPA